MFYKLSQYLTIHYTFIKYLSWWESQGIVQSGGRGKSRNRRGDITVLQSCLKHLSYWLHTPLVFQHSHRTGLRIPWAENCKP